MIALLPSELLDNAWSIDQATRRLAHDLQQAIVAQGQAILAVCGGRSPLGLFAALRVQNIDWSSVSITLVDDRDVPADHADSNQALIAAHLRQDQAAQARWTPIQDYAEMRQSPDIALLGLGEDGHFASLFPAMLDDDRAFSLQAEPQVLHTPPMGSPLHPRISMNLAMLSQAGLLLLMVSGGKKATVLRRAEDDCTLPAHRLLHMGHPNLHIVYQP